MKKAAILIDAWKKQRFEKALNKNDFYFSVEPGPVKDTLSIVVRTDRVLTLAKVVEKTNKKCAKAKQRADLYGL